MPACAALAIGLLLVPFELGCTRSGFESYAPSDAGPPSTDAAPADHGQRLDADLADAPRTDAGRPDQAPLDSGSAVDRVAFAPRIDLATHSAAEPFTGPVGVTIAHANVDGFADLIVTNDFVGTFSVLAGDGAGHFTQADYGTGYDPQEAHVGDFDGDGHPDVAVAHWSSLGVSVYLGQSDGTLGAQTRYLGTSTVVALALADLDGDLDVDIASVGEANRVTIFLNDGDGGFATTHDEVFQENLYDIVAADLDRDGALDLAVVDDASALTVLRGDGSGTGWQRIPIALAAAPLALTAGDFDRDGDLDLAVANDAERSVTVLANSGNGVAFATADIAMPDWLRSIETGDLDGDGWLDLATTYHDCGAVSILFNRGNGSFADRQDLAMASAQTSSNNLFAPRIALGDVDGDGRLDVAVSCEADDSVQLFLNSTTE